LPVNIPDAPANVPADTIPLNSAAVPLTLPVNAAPLTTVSWLAVNDVTDVTLEPIPVKFDPSPK